MTYNSKEYWNNRPNPNKGTEPEEVDRKFIPPFLEGSRFVLEFGCGVGRMYEFYKGLEVVGLDFASQYETACKLKSIEHGLSRYHHIIHDVHKKMLPFKKDTFDKGLLIKVLLHATPRECRTILFEMSNVCKEVLLISYNGKPEGLASHCFKHDYVKELKRLNMTIISKEEYGNQIIIRYKA